MRSGFDCEKACCLSAVVLDVGKAASLSVSLKAKPSG